MNYAFMVHRKDSHPSHVDITFITYLIVTVIPCKKNLNFSSHNTDALIKNSMNHIIIVSYNII